MSFAPFAAIWVLLVAAAVIALFAERRPKWAVAATVASSLLAFAIWYLFRPETTAPSLSFAGRQWAVDEAGWQLTGIVLLLSLTAGVRAAIVTGSDHRMRQPAIALALSATVLPAVWAADDRTRLMGVGLFATVWTLLLLATDEAAGSDSPRFNWREGGLLLAALFPLWASSAVPDGREFWGVVATLLLIIAGALAGPRVSARFDAISAILPGYPIVAGAAVLIGVLGAGMPAMAGVVAATVAGLLSLLVGMAWAWDRSEALAPALALGLGGIVLVAAAWAGQPALLNATRLAVLAPALVALALGSPARLSASELPQLDLSAVSRRGVSPQLIALLVAYLAVAGLPLTVGFGALGPIYESWSGAAGWVLLLVMVALLSLWLAAIYQAGRAVAHAATAGRAAWFGSLALVPPAFGLIAPDLGELGTSLTTWAAIVVPVLAGVALGHFAPDIGAFGGLLREAATLPQPLANATSRIRGAGRLVADALADALAILEGENGLIWLLGLLLLIIWIT